ncbi:MAG: helix-turn-helix transcriptional regulator [Calothrix sp. SM1_5_4]|nr:helix-turn-helix transcriptional regulator [Calothrix sp. SM1_5_4]
MKDMLNIKFPKSESGDIVRAFRKMAGLTQADLAEVTGIAESHISAIESGRVKIGIDRALAFAAAFGIDPDRILFPNGVDQVLATPKLQKIRRAAESKIKVRARASGE